MKTMQELKDEENELLSLLRQNRRDQMEIETNNLIFKWGFKTDDMVYLDVQKTVKAVISKVENGRYFAKKLKKDGTAGTRESYLWDWDLKVISRITE